MQIYCDFSGYSDIAIGISRIIGFDLPENFKTPYVATSVTEFWRRWHMTLSSWLRDYLYIPLGGNRKGRLRTYVNLTLTMLVAKPQNLRSSGILSFTSDLSALRHDSQMRLEKS